VAAVAASYGFQSPLPLLPSSHSHRLTSGLAGAGAGFSSFFGGAGFGSSFFSVTSPSTLVTLSLFLFLSF
jgi:hypothetical protein